MQEALGGFCAGGEDVENVCQKEKGPRAARPGFTAADGSYGAFSVQDGQSHFVHSSADPLPAFNAGAMEEFEEHFGHSLNGELLLTAPTYGLGSATCPVLALPLALSEGDCVMEQVVDAFARPLQYCTAQHAVKVRQQEDDKSRIGMPRELLRKRKAPDRFCSESAERLQDQARKKIRKAMPAKDRATLPGRFKNGVPCSESKSASGRAALTQVLESLTHILESLRSYPGAGTAPEAGLRIDCCCSLCQTSAEHLSLQVRQAHESLIEQEETVIDLYKNKGLDIILDAKVSVVNKKIDILLARAGSFSRSKFFAAMKGIKRKKLMNHVICITKVRSNGEGTESSTSNIFGKPLVRTLSSKAEQPWSVTLEVFGSGRVREIAGDKAVGPK